MLTIAQASNALKQYYLGVITNQLNTRVNPLLAKINQSAEHVYGREVVKVFGYGINGGIGASDEAGDLPKAAEGKYAKISVTLKNLYGRIELSDKVIRASRSSSGAFVSMLNSEMEGLLEAASLNLSRMIYGDGSGMLATVVSADDSSKTITVDSVKKIVEGMTIQVITSRSSSTPTATGLRVKNINRINRTVVVEGGSLASVAADQVVAVASGLNQELTGLEKVLSTSSMIYSASRNANPFLMADIDDTTSDVTETAIQGAIDRIEEATGDNINFIACSYGVKRALQNHLASYRRNIDTMNLEGGFKAISYNGIPVVADRFCAEKTMYLLNTDYFTLCQLCDWEWLVGENGTVLKQIPGTATYSATLVKYAELLCEKIKAQAVFTNLTEA